MADRGSPLPFKLREEIRYHAQNRMPETKIAIAVGVARMTVRKYLGKLKRRDMNGQSCPN